MNVELACLELRF